MPRGGRFHAPRGIGVVDVTPVTRSARTAGRTSLPYAWIMSL